MGFFRTLYSHSDFLVRSFFTVSLFAVLLTYSFRPLFTYTLYGKRLKSYYLKVSPKFLVPKNCFANFYLLSILLNIFLFYKERLEITNLYRVMYITHVLRRLLEQAFLFTKLPKPSFLHVVGYLFGLWYFYSLIFSYYVATALALNNPSSYYPFGYSVLLNCFAQFLQFYSHVKLSELRRDVKDETRVYKVPTAGPFKYILCPHYLAEILIYVSLCCNLNM
nr:hypothetical protein MACL_00001903 [Theileria orientalis]